MACYSPTTGLSGSLFRISHRLSYRAVEGKLHLDLYALTTHDIIPRSLSATALFFSNPPLPHSESKDLGPVSLMSCVEQLPSIRLVILSFDDILRIDAARRADPTIFTAPTPNSHGEIAYRVLCRYESNSAFADIPMVYGSRHTLVEINPTTMLPVGRC